MKLKSSRGRVTYAVVIFSLIFAVALTNCKKKDSTPAPAPQPDPKACFTSDKQRLEDSEIVTFSNCSTNATTYQWDFGDGTSSTIASPTKYYTAKGSYAVKMTALANNKQSTDAEYFYWRSLC